MQGHAAQIFYSEKTLLNNACNNFIPTTQPKASTTECDQFR